MLNGEIMIFTDSLSRGGTERHLAMVAPKLASQGFLLSIFLLKGGGPLAQDIIDGGVNSLSVAGTSQGCSSYY